jgi:7-carboxy-7-deazaguanine synthase
VADQNLNNTTRNDVLSVSEIFYSIQGESRFAGYPCGFIRLAGCNLNCEWCDTRHARDEGFDISISDILITLQGYHTGLVMITGGEPLHQPGTPLLLSELIKMDYTTLLETNGSYSLEGLDKKIIKIVDVKTPSSGEAESFHISNLEYMSEKDELNFVITGRDDFNWAIAFLENHTINKDVIVNFTPAFDMISLSELAEWIKTENRKDVKLSMQLHKFIWGDKKGV